MLTGLENGLGLDIVVWLQAHGGALLDLLANLLALMGSSMFALLIAPLIYWTVNKRLGMQMTLTLLFGALIAAVIKQIAQTPRPFFAHPDTVNALFHPDGYGLPSGHVVNAMTFWLPGVVWLKDRRWWWAYGIFALVMGWSRMYGGVHYPQDVVAALVIGLALIALYLRWPPGPNVFRSRALIGVMLVLPWLLIGLLADYDSGLTVLGVIFGCGVGLLLEPRYAAFEVRGTLRQRALRYAMGVALMLVLYAGLRIVFGTAEPHAVLRVVRYAVVAVFLVAGWPVLWRRANL